MVERFLNFVDHAVWDAAMRPEIDDLINEIQELKSFGICEVRSLTQLDNLERFVISLDWKWLLDQGKGAYIYAKGGLYEVGGQVQIIETRHNFDRNLEGFTTSIRIGLGEEPYEALTHSYLARPMTSKSDLLTEKDLLPVTLKKIKKLDPVIIFDND